MVVTTTTKVVNKWIILVGLLMFAPHEFVNLLDKCGMKTCALPSLLDLKGFFLSICAMCALDCWTVCLCKAKLTQLLASAM